MPLLRSLKNGKVEQFGFGEIAMKTFVISDKQTVSAEPPISLKYDYFLLLPPDPNYAKIVSYYEAYGIPIPEGYGLPELTLQQQLEIQQLAMDVFLYKGLSSQFLADYDVKWLKPLRDQLMVPTILSSEPTAQPTNIVLDPSAQPTETASTPAVAVSSNTVANASNLATQPLTVKFSEYLQHPLAKLLELVGR